MSTLRRRTRDGFTLIEVTVALALMGLIAAALIVSLQFGQRSYQKIVRVDAATWEIASTQRLLRQLIETAYPLEEPVPDQLGLRGNARSLQVLSAALHGSADIGLQRYDIDLRPHGARFDLVIRWQADLDALASGSAAQSEEILLEKVAALDWTYCCAEQGAAAAPQWQNEWLQRELPRLVRLRVRFAAEDARRWPELIIAPRLTDDANCVFDVVAQRCRGAS